MQVSSSPCFASHSFLRRVWSKRLVRDSCVIFSGKASASNDVDYAFGALGYNFSSRVGWDKFYEQDDESSVFEWHSEVKNEDIVREVVNRLRGQCGIYIDQDSKSWSSVPSHLLIGTGNSLLPRILYETLKNEGNDCNVTCLDYSSPCIDNLKKAHGSECPRMTFIHGDATKLANIFEADLASSKYFDSVIDKGLIDALMCSEGWDGPVASVLKGVSSTLRDNGFLLLVSFKLSESTKEFLIDSTFSDLTWEFDTPIGDKVYSNRISVSVATRKPRSLTS